jgi:cytochrome c556
MVVSSHQKDAGMFRIVTLLALCAGIAAFGGIVRAQVPADRPPYEASFGDLMTMAIQPRHLKLGLAGQEKNWAYADYELRELQGAFKRVGRAIPIYRATDMTALIAATTAAPIAGVATAIKNGDAAKFAEAYGQLTATCNACHQSTGHDAVVIQVPHTSAYPNQDFRPAKP